MKMGKKWPIANEVPDFNSLKKSYKELKAVFFDMDGTIFDTEVHHALALSDILKLLKLTPLSSHECQSRFYGLTDAQVYDELKREMDIKINAEDFISLKTEAVFKHLGSSKLLNNKLEALLNEIKNQNYPIVLVTSSEKKITMKILEQEKMLSIFKAVFTREDTEDNKPHPAPYLEAMKLCGVKPNEVLIFEDSPSGLEAAERSGAHVIQVKWFNHPIV